MSRDAKEGAMGPTAVPPLEPSDRVPIGLRFKGRYRIISELGAGAFGTVCLAEDEATGHRVAIRLLPRGLADVRRARQARQRTGRSIVAASAAHPALVRVLDFGTTENGQDFVAMEHVVGRPLSEILSKGPVDVGTALRLALDLGGSVETLHNMGLVHGALRPRNVMVLADGRVKLMDLELTGLRDAPAMKGIIAAEPPPEYLSPEQIRRGLVTEKTDIYAFGVILYEMLCGVPPFQAETREAVHAKHLTETPVPVHRRRHAVPVSVESAIALALYKQPELRPPMQNVLNRLWAEANRPAARWKRTAAMLGGGALAGAIAALVAWGLFAPRLSAPPALVAPLSAPATSSAPISKTFTAPAPATTAPGMAPVAAAPPSSARSSVSPPPKVAGRDQPRVPQAATGRASERPAESSDEEAYDSGAVIDWLLKRSADRDH